jgi:hypothetical protein
VIERPYRVALIVKSAAKRPVGLADSVRALAARLPPGLSTGRYVHAFRAIREAELADLCDAIAAAYERALREAFPRNAPRRRR